MARSCKDYLSVAATMIENDRHDYEVQMVLEKVRDMLMQGTARLSTFEYFWLCKKYGIACLSLNRIREAEYFLNRAINLSVAMGNLDEISIVVSLSLGLLLHENRYGEGISMGEKYVSLCSGSENVSDIEEALCMLYFCYGWRRKARNLANKVIRNRRKNRYWYYSETTLSFYKISYNYRICKDNEFLLSDWYEVACHVKGFRSSAAMEVLAEKARVIAHDDKNRTTEAVRLLDQAIPVLEKKGCEYSIIDVPRLISYQAQLKYMIGESAAALRLFAKAKPLFSDSDADKDFLNFIDEEIVKIKASLSEEKTDTARRQDGSL